MDKYTVIQIVLAFIACALSCFSLGNCVDALCNIKDRQRAEASDILPVWTITMRTYKFVAILVGIFSAGLAIGIGIANLCLR